jgi:ABC-type multidrug transport system ATPase subunit
VHELVLQEKSRRCVLLTTHLMSEAEKLCDRIAIMAHGKLVTIGTSQELKNKYNDGFKITVVVSDRERARRYIEAQFPGCELESEVNQRLVFRFPPSAKFSMAKVWAAMLDKASGNGIPDWQISATTLEDVFVAIAKDSEARFGTA